MLIRLIAGVLLFAAGIFTEIKLIFLVAYIVLGYDVLIQAFRDIRNIFNENFLMSIASIGAFVIGEYHEAVAVMLFYQIGESLSDYAVGKSKKSISSLMDLRADTARVLRNGEFTAVPCEDVKIGETILVTTGEKVPLDGTIISGSAYFDTSALTGEAKPLLISENENVMSGIINTNSAVRIRVDKIFSESTVSKILELVQDGNKAKSEKFISKFARVYTPIVVLAAILIAIIPTLITGDFHHWIYTAMLFLVVSCPCALVVSVPLTFFAGIGCASKNGILVKGGYVLENLAKTKNMAFDKTGTLTEGKFKVQELRANGIKAEVLEYAAYAEFYSPHPIAKAIVEAYGKSIDTTRISEYKEIAGNGVSALIDGRLVLVGSQKFLSENNIDCKGSPAFSVLVSIDGSFCGGIVVEDRLKTNAKEALGKLRDMGIDISILTGDNKSNAKSVSETLQVSDVYAGLLPQDKVSTLRNLQARGISAFVGDGINDAPVLSCADAGISMGGLGSDAAIEASDVVIMADEIAKIPLAVSIARKTLTIVKQNIWIALGIKLLIMLLGVIGIATMWLAVFADVGVCLLAVVNALRALRIDNSN
ncbi:MAG: cadmium-translocating P-type ATPase [Clostridia bacterium]|nr:cadmium-translocating P-type ATPase [Clostridia bacterium]